jgi:hypothetical protein
MWHSSDSRAVEGKFGNMSMDKVCNLNIFQEMRLELDNVLEDKISSPNTDLMTDPRGSAIIKTIVRLISTE